MKQRVRKRKNKRTMSSAEVHRAGNAAVIEELSRLGYATMIMPVIRNGVRRRVRNYRIFVNGQRVFVHAMHKAHSSFPLVEDRLSDGIHVFVGLFGPQPEYFILTREQLDEVRYRAGERTNLPLLKAADFRGQWSVLGVPC